MTVAGRSPAFQVCGVTGDGIDICVAEQSPGDVGTLGGFCSGPHVLGGEFSDFPATLSSLSFQGFSRPWR